MYNQYIEKLLRMPEVKLQTVEIETNQEVYLLVRPVAYVQPCSLCQSIQSVIRKGTNEIRTIRHLSCFEVQVYLRVPAIRMFCKNYECGFVWQYTFVEPKKGVNRTSCLSLAAQRGI